MRVLHFGDSKNARPACGSGSVGGRSPKQSPDWARVTCKRCLERKAQIAEAAAIYAEAAAEQATPGIRW